MRYVAVKPIGRFKVGDFVGGLSETEIKHHLKAGNIKEAEVKTKREVKHGA